MISWQILKWELNAYGFRSTESGSQRIVLKKKKHFWTFYKKPIEYLSWSLRGIRNRKFQNPRNRENLTQKGKVTLRLGKQEILDGFWQNTQCPASAQCVVKFLSLCIPSKSEIPIPWLGIVAAAAVQPSWGWTKNTAPAVPRQTITHFKTDLGTGHFPDPGESPS